MNNTSKAEQYQNKIHQLNNRSGEKNEDERYRIRVTGSYVVIGLNNSGIGSFSNIPERGEIKSLSVSSAARMRKYLRECTSEYKVFITLTYPFGMGLDGQRAKRDLDTFIKRYRRYAQSIKFSAFWFMEFQKSGSIHFHIFGTDTIPKGMLSTWWYEIVGSDDDRHLAAGTRIEGIRCGRGGISSYASKYASKQQQKIVPKNISWAGRFWGVYGVKKCVSAYTLFGDKRGLSNENDKLLDVIENDFKKGQQLGTVRKLKTSFMGRVWYVSDEKLLRKINLRVSMLGGMRDYGWLREHAGIDGHESM